MEAVIEIIRKANPQELRLLDICLKERKQEILDMGSESFQPYRSVSVSRIRNRDFLYLHHKVKGKTVSRVIKDAEIKNFDFSSVKVSQKAKTWLAANYGI